MLFHHKCIITTTNGDEPFGLMGKITLKKDRSGGAADFWKKIDHRCLSEIICVMSTSGP